METQPRFVKHIFVLIVLCCPYKTINGRPIVLRLWAHVYKQCTFDLSWSSRIAHFIVCFDIYIPTKKI